MNLRCKEHPELHCKDHLDESKEEGRFAIGVARYRTPHAAGVRYLATHIANLVIFSTCLALRRAQRIGREVIEAEEARAACAQGSLRTDFQVLRARTSVTVSVGTPYFPLRYCLP